MADTIKNMFDLKKNIEKYGGVPSDALRFAVDGNNVEGEVTKEKGVKVSLKARSKLPVKNHPVFGNTVHDFSTMTIPNKIAIDYEHEKEIGYTKSYSIDNEGLKFDGVIFKNSENPQHPANDAIFNLTNGIPMQASIDFSQGEYEVEVVPPDQSIIVNGINYAAGMIDTVIKNFKICAVAICKLGADDHTESVAVFSANRKNPKNMEKLNLTEDASTKEVVAEKVEEKSVEVTDMTNTQFSNSETVITKSVDEEVVIKESEKPEEPSQPEMPMPETPDMPMQEDMSKKVEDDMGKLMEELKARLAVVEEELACKTKKLVEQEASISAQLKANEEVQAKFTKLKESIGEEPMRQSSGVAENFKSWRECVEKFAQSTGKSYDDAHLACIVAYPEFHKKQIKKIK